MEKKKKHNIISGLTEYYDNINGGKFSIKSIFKFIYCIFRFFWILWMLISTIVVFIIVTVFYFILGKNCRGCIFLKKEHNRETKWCTIYHVKYFRRCKDYNTKEEIKA